ncbi:MAG: PqqD family protein [Clostridiales bacterium]|nr:PqqD family protein [Candidatus Equinaster intestinalis]
MKIKSSYILRNVAGENLVVPLGEGGVNFNSVITLNGSGKFLWELLQEDTDEAALIEAVLREYEVDRTTAERDVLGFVKSLKDNGILED